MTNEELNTALYKKVFAKQEQYREWLLSQPPDEILNHCYEYTVREDIVLALEEYDLSDKQCKALLKSPCPLADVFKDFEKRETDHMDIWLCQDRHTVFSEFFQLPPKWGALIVLACRYKFKPARSTHIYLNLS